MRLAVAAVWLCLVACEKQGEPPAADETVEDRGWRIKAARERAKTVLWSKASEQALVESKRLETIDTDLQTALAERSAALTMAARRDADAKLELIRGRIDEASKATTAIQEAARADERRIEALPDRCFDGPAPADCKL